MLIYGYVGKKALKNDDFWNNLHTNRALYYYNYELTKENATYEKGRLLARHVYNSYSTLCRFNNSLTSTYEVDDKEVRKFVAYLDRFVRQTSSKNDINYRISSLYNYIVSKYSDYMEINEIVLNEN